MNSWSMIDDDSWDDPPSTKASADWVYLMWFIRDVVIIVILFRDRDMEPHFPTNQCWESATTKDGRSTRKSPTDKDGGSTGRSGTNTRVGGTGQTGAEGATVCSGGDAHRTQHNTNTNKHESGDMKRL